MKFATCEFSFRTELWDDLNYGTPLLYPHRINRPGTPVPTAVTKRTRPTHRCYGGVLRNIGPVVPNTTRPPLDDIEGAQCTDGCT